MNTFHVSADVVERLGWVLVHSAWQFALIALFAGAMVRAMRQYSAATGYGVLVVAMAVSVAAPVFTWLLMPSDVPAHWNRVSFSASDLSGALDRETRLVEFASDATLEREGGRELSKQGPRASGADSKKWPLVSPRASAEFSAQQFHSNGVPLPPSWPERASLIIRPWLGWIVVVWGLGAVICSARPLLSWYTVRRLRRVGVSPVPAVIATMLEQISQRLHLRQSVQILQSTLTHVPVVIGYLRPVILLPASVIAGIPTSQLEAILAHELAHVRRHDFLVNLLQTLIETLFFYHPAVWWLSRHIRVERENCCDDLAVAALGNRVEYGRALLALQERRGTSTALALGARSGSLLDRVQRLFRRDPAERTVGAIGIVGVGLLAILILALGVWNSTQAEKPQPPADDHAAREHAAEQEAWEALDALKVTIYGDAANRWTLQSKLRNMERTNFPEKAIRDLRQQLEQPVRAADFWIVPAEAWTHIGQLKSLQELQVVASDLRGQPMDEIGRLTNLRKLSIINSKCNPQDLAPLRELTDLEHLEVMCTVFEESGAWRTEQLGELTADEQAMVARCVAMGPNRESMAEAAILTDRVLASLRGLRRLRTLKLANTYVSGHGLESLKALPAIEELDLNLIEFTPEAARIVGGLQALKRFRYADVSDETLAPLASLSELEELEVWAGGVTDRGVDHLLKLSKLRKLALRGSQLSDAGVQRLATLPHLESLDLKPQGTEPVEVATEAAQPAPADKVVGQPTRDASVVAQIPDEAYKRPTADDQRATATIAAEAWGEPVDGLRVAIVLNSPPIDKDGRLRYDVVAENVSDHDIRFGATLGVDDWHNYCKTKLIDADGNHLVQQEGTLLWLRSKLERLWLKPKERCVISSWTTGLLKQEEDAQSPAKSKDYRGPWYFSVKPGQYSVSAAVELGPSMYSTDPATKKRTVLSPAKGEWSGKLQTGAVPVGLFTDPVADPAPADESTAKSPRDTSLNLVAEIPDTAYTRPTAKDQEATALIPAEAWGEPVDGLRLAVVLHSPPIDKDERLCYDIVVENVSDHDIRFSAEVGIDTWHFFFKSKLVDADGMHVELQRRFQTYLGHQLIRIWLKPSERYVISSWTTKLLKLDDEGKSLASPDDYHGYSSFSVKPGRYSLSAAMELGSGMYSTDPATKKRTVLSPAKGEWSGKLQTGAVPVALFTDPAPADEAAAKRPSIGLRRAAAEARRTLLRSERDKVTHPSMELRIAVSKDDRESDDVAWFPITITAQRKPVPAGESGANLPIEEKLNDRWHGLLWDKAEHALLADGTWRVVKCEVAQSAQSTDLAPSFEIRVTVDAFGGESLRQLTRSHLNERLAIVVEGTIIATPVVRDEFGAEFVIMGNFTKEAAEQLAAAIQNPDQRKTTLFVLSFAKAESAFTALKEEAMRRKIDGFEAACDPQQNSVAITTADAETLTALQEILAGLDVKVAAPNPESDALSKLAGVWIAEKVTSSDKVVPKEKFPFELHFEKDKLIFRFVAPSLGKDRVHDIVVDETKTPATIDITREIRGKKETVYAIFKLDGDRLLIHSFRDGNGKPSDKRPTTFESSKEDHSDLLVLTRKPTPALAGDKPTMKDILATKVTFEWDNGSLESCLLALETKVKADHPVFRIKIIGDDLKLEGITRNQRIRGLNLKDKTLAEVLTAIVLKGNPNPLVKDTSDRELKLVWDIATDPDEPGVQAVLITTRDGARKRKETLPDIFEKK